MAVIVTIVPNHSTESPKECDTLIEKQYGQDLIDSLSVLEAVVPTLHEELWPKLAETFPMMNLALRSRFAIIRQSAARCFATICDVMTSEAMRFVIEQIVPLLGDPLVLAHRQGATELIYRSHFPLSLLFDPPPTNLIIRHCPTTRHQGTPLCDIHGSPGSGQDE